MDESEARASELQADVETLRSQLEEQSERARRAERDQAVLVAELTAQNTRLADQLREAAKQEEQLLLEVKVLREKCALRNTTLQDHVSSLEILRDEVNLIFSFLERDSRATIAYIDITRRLRSFTPRLIGSRGGTLFRFPKNDDDY